MTRSWPSSLTASSSHDQHFCAGRYVIPAEEIPVGPISSPTLVDAVTVRLRSSILRGRFAPGERLVEADLARELGISRGPIREALGVLERDGIVVNVPRKGKFVLNFDRVLINEIYSLRKVLEIYAVELIIERLTDTEGEALSIAVAQIEDAASLGSISLAAERDLEFHNRLYELSGHQLLRTVWTKNMASKLRMLVNITTRTHDPLMDTRGSHRALIDAILAGDKPEARRLVCQHVDDAWRRASSALEAAGEAEVPTLIFVSKRNNTWPRSAAP
jgi:DNA-binding GntR family transcriptional regulator